MLQGGYLRVTFAAALTLGLLIFLGSSATSVRGQVIIPEKANSADTADLPVTGDGGSGSSASRTAPKKSGAVYHWNGFYAGGFGGVMMNRSSANTSTVFSTSGYFASTSVDEVNSDGVQGLHGKGFQGGGTLGYNHQGTGHLVFGAEADIAVVTGSKSATVTDTYICCAATYTLTQSVKTPWVFTARPRVGWSFGGIMVYATGGLALTRPNYLETFTDTFANANQIGGSDTIHLGWTGGGGVEFKVGKRWSVKGEYLFDDFGKITSTSTNLTATIGPGSFPASVFTNSLSVKQDNVRIGINYHF